MAFSGIYREVVPGARLVYTQIFEPMPDAGEGVITATFEVHESGTLLTQRELYSIEGSARWRNRVRDGAWNARNAGAIGRAFARARGSRVAGPMMNSFPFRAC